MTSIGTCLWFDGRAEEAAAFYTAVFGGEITRVTRSSGLDRSEGDVVTVDFRILDRDFTALDGGPGRAFSEAVSFVVPCDDQAEIDRLWDALTADGGRPGRCGWLTDRFGLSWQIVPSILPGLLAGADREAADRVGRVVLASRKLDIAEIAAARSQPG